MATGTATACGLLKERRNHGMPDGGVDGKKVEYILRYGGGSRDIVMMMMLMTIKRVY